jgi:hypothetical protein
MLPHLSVVLDFIAVMLKRADWLTGSEEVALENQSILTHTSMPLQMEWKVLKIMFVTSLLTLRA